MISEDLFTLLKLLLVNLLFELFDGGDFIMHDLDSVIVLPMRPYISNY